MMGSEVRLICSVNDFATIVRDDVFSPTPCPLSVNRLLPYAAWFDLRVEIGRGMCFHVGAVEGWLG